MIDVLDIEDNYLEKNSYYPTEMIDVLDIEDNYYIENNTED